MNIEGLKQVVRVLREVQNDDAAALSFSLQDWMNTEAMTLKDLRSNKDRFKEADATGASLISIPHKCGTTSCAMGYAGLDPWFRQRGFKTAPGGGLLYEYFTLGGEPEEAMSWGAVKKFLELETTDAYHLFGSEYYRQGTLEEVIQRVEHFIKHEEAE